MEMKSRWRRRWRRELEDRTVEGLDCNGEVTGTQ